MSLERIVLQAYHFVHYESLYPYHSMSQYYYYSLDVKHMKRARCSKEDLASSYPLAYSHSPPSMACIPCNCDTLAVTQLFYVLYVPANYRSLSSCSVPLQSSMEWCDLLSIAYTDTVLTHIGSASLSVPFYQVSASLARKLCPPPEDPLPLVGKGHTCISYKHWRPYSHSYISIHLLLRLKRALTSSYA